MNDPIDALDPEKLFGEGGRVRVIGHAGELVDEADSTMDLCRERAQSGAADGYVVLAEAQRAGRGRDGDWECPPGRGILLSALVRRGLRSSRRKLLGIMSAVAATEAVRRFVPAARIKWPNDVVVCRRTDPLSLSKLGGVLVEQVHLSDRAPAHVLGIGLNVNQTADELPENPDVPATSIRLERGEALADRTPLCSQLLDRLDFWYGLLLRGQCERLLARWRTLSCLMGHRVKVRAVDQAFVGEVLGLRSSGELIVRDPTGRRHFLEEQRSELIFGSQEDYPDPTAR